MSKIFGLIVCGGKSSRMGVDKSTLDYHGRPQRYYLYDLLVNLCDDVFISCNKEQAKQIPSEYNTIPDATEYKEIGPMAALLSAFKKYPDATFLVVGCDYPFINRHHLKKLVNVKLEDVPAIAFYDKWNDHYEPLIAVYQSNILDRLKNHFKQKDYSLQAVLKEVNAYRINASSPDILRSVNTEEEYEEVAAIFKNYR